MKDLKSYQDIFVNAVLKEEENENLLDQMNAIGKLQPKDVLNVYRQDYFSRLTEALGETFEATWLVLGDEEFFKMAKNYIDDFPSNIQDLNLYGEQLSVWLEEKGYREHFSGLPELATFEWSFWQYFHRAPAAPPTDDPFTQLSEDKIPQAKFSFNPNFKFFSWEYSLYDIWKQRQGQDNQEIDWDRPQSVILYKKAKEVQVKELNSYSALLWQELEKGESLGNALDKVENIAPEDLSHFLVFLRGSGLVKNIYF
jgi:hypothetical protein